MRYILTRLGRRGTILMLFAVVFILFGIKSLLDSALPEHDFYLWTYFPPYLRFALFEIPSITAIIAAWMPRRSSDGFGFSVLTVPVTIVATLHLLSFVGFILNITNYGLGWTDALVWFTILLLLLITSGWAEVKPTHQKED